jgi:hypothetical protein
VAVDGGVIDNEPFELARRFLSDQAEPNPDNRNGIKTSYAVLLVDPFPNRAGWPPEGGSDLLSDLIGPLISTLVDQARFKPQELALALNDSVCSRFAILPEPMLDTDKARKLPIACGALGGFSGFLEHSFRRHDYLLGKRNAQAFLRWHLHLPKSNPLFTPWESRGGNLEAWYVREVTERPERSIAPGADLAQRWKLVPKTVQDPDKPRPETEPALPIIPLTRRLQEPIVIGPEDRPRPERVDIPRLEDELSARFSSVVQILVDRDLREYVPAGPVGRFALKQFLPGVLTRRAVRAISMAMDEITAAFQG